jgi:phosphoribosylanthranilate isomerase
MQHPTQDDLDSVLEYFKPTYIQSDADDFESIKLPNEIKKIKVYRTEKGLDISNIDNQSLSLLEGSTSGSGQMANKEILKKACKSNKLFIAGGLSPDNISSILETVNPFGVDVSSGVESTRGIKSREKIIQFNKIVHAFNESKL